MFPIKLSGQEINLLLQAAGICWISSFCDLNFGTLAVPCLKILPAFDDFIIPIKRRFPVFCGILRILRSFWDADWVERRQFLGGFSGGPVPDPIPLPVRARRSFLGADYSVFLLFNGFLGHLFRPLSYRCNKGRIRVSFIVGLP